MVDGGTVLTRAIKHDGFFYCRGVKHRSDTALSLCGLGGGDGGGDGGSGGGAVVVVLVALVLQVVVVVVLV